MNLSPIKDRVDEVQRGRRWLAFPFAVTKKFGEDSSSNLAVLITYYLFFSIFPLLLAAFSILGFVLHGHPDWQQSIQNSTFKQLPLIPAVTPKHGSVLIVVVGIALALYSGLAVVKAAQNAWDIVYGVPKGERPGFVPKNLRALRLVGVGGTGAIATTVIAASVSSGKIFGLSLGHGFHIVGLLVTVALNTLLFTLIFRWLTVRVVTFRDVLPGAAFFAVALAAMQSIVAAFISHKLSSTNSTYGKTFGTVIILLSWFYLQSQVLLLAAQINVVKQDHLWPRSLNEKPHVEP